MKLLGSRWPCRCQYEGGKLLPPDKQPVTCTEDTTWCHHHCANSLHNQPVVTTCKNGVLLDVLADVVATITKSTIHVDAGAVHVATITMELRREHVVVSPHLN